MGFTATYVVVGEAPARDESKRHLDVVLACKSVRRRPVAGTMAWLKEGHRGLFNFVLRTTHVNLLGSWPGADGRGSRFPMAEARERAVLFKRSVREEWAITTVEGRRLYEFGGRRFERPDLVLLAGWRVAQAFRIHHGSRQYFVVDPKTELLADLPTVVVPHPSGVNRWWNDAENRDRARWFLRGLGGDPC